MFNVGSQELIFILIVGLVFVGPDQLPGIIRQATKVFRESKDLAENVKSDFIDTFAEPLNDMSDTFTKPLNEIKDPISALNDSIKAGKDSIVDGVNSTLSGKPITANPAPVDPQTVTDEDFDPRYDVAVDESDDEQSADSKSLSEESTTEFIETSNVDDVKESDEDYR